MCILIGETVPHIPSGEEQGLMFGSGPVEAANKTVIQARLKKSGQRWTMDGANALIQLRTVNKSEKWGLVVNAVKKAAQRSFDVRPFRG